MTTLITGGTGLLGRRLIEELDDAVVLTRNPARWRSHFPGRELREWAPLSGALSADLLGEPETIVHLAGEPIADGRWTVARKRQIHESRVAATRNLVAGLARLERKPSVLVSASAVGFYGDGGDELLDEYSARGTGFVAGLCSAWEAEALAAREFDIRVVCLRFGIVLSAEGGALARMLPPFRMGVGGRLGSGRQWMPWIHVDDAVGLIRHAIARPELSGVVNAVAPQLVTNAEFTTALGVALERPTRMVVPGMALKLGLGEMSEVLLGSQMVVPRRAMESGYAYQFPRLPGALEDLVGRRSRQAAA